jgi:hypothetical protein
VDEGDARPRRARAAPDQVQAARAVLSLLDDLAPDAELEFTGIPVGPFAGREAIGEAYRVQPPDDEIVLLDQLGDLSAVCAWDRDSARPAGEMHLEERDGAIVRIRVLYEQFSG